MKNYLIILIIFCLSCLANLPAPFRYIHGGSYSEVSLKVIPIYIDKDFGQADKIAIGDAISQWNYALNGYERLVIMDDQFDMNIDVIKKCLSGDGWIILRVESENELVRGVDRGDKPGTYTLGWANEIGGNYMYIVRDRILNNWVTGITLHEMGHLLGAAHDDVYLMKPQFNWEDSRCIDYSTLEGVARYQHLPIEELNYCIYE